MSQFLLGDEVEILSVSNGDKSMIGQKGIVRSTGSCECEGFPIKIDPYNRSGYWYAKENQVKLRRRFKVGDAVEITQCATMPGCSCNGKFAGKRAHIKERASGTDGDWYLDINTDSHHWGMDELKLVSKSKGETATMGKLFRVIKDHPVWETGAILEENEEGDYVAMDDLFVKEFEKGEPEGYCETAWVIENQPTFFERVYEVKLLKKVLYMNKADARNAHNELYKPKK